MGIGANESVEYEGKEERRKRKKGERPGLVDFLGPTDPAFARAMRKNGPVSRVRRAGPGAIFKIEIDLRRNFQNPWTHSRVRSR